MNTEEKINELAKKVEENAKRSEKNVKQIYENIERLHNHDEQINKNTGSLNVFSDVLKTIKTYNTRFFTMWILTFIALLVSIGVNIYLLNDTSIVETETSQEIKQENESGSNNYIGNDGDIIYGKAND